MGCNGNTYDGAAVDLMVLFRGARVFLELCCVKVSQSSIEQRRVDTRSCMLTELHGALCPRREGRGLSSRGYCLGSAARRLDACELCFRRVRQVSGPRDARGCDDLFVGSYLSETIGRSRRGECRP